jgi:hypothetical protein
MIDPGDILEPTLEEAKRLLEEMRQTKDLEQRKTQSEVLRNLCQSAGIFFDLLANAMDVESFPDEEDEGLFDEEED